MTIDSEWDDDIDEMVADLPTTIKLIRTGEEVACTVSHVGKTDDVAAEGVFNVGNLEAGMKLSLWTATDGVPNVRDVVQIGGASGAKYSVLSKDTDSVGLRLLLRRI